MLEEMTFGAAQRVKLVQRIMDALARFGWHLTLTAHGKAFTACSGLCGYRCEALLGEKLTYRKSLRPDCSSTFTHFYPTHLSRYQ